MKQGFSTRGIELIIPEYSGLGTEELRHNYNTLIHFEWYVIKRITYTNWLFDENILCYTYSV